jgi:hypothetical protein
MKTQDDYLTTISIRVRDIPDSARKPPCPVITTSRGKQFPQHRYVLVYLGSDLIEYRCIDCLEYLTYKPTKPGQQELF